MKATRLLAILSRLQARGRATAQELADLHEVSVRTIYRDIDALSAAGFPVYGDAGPGGGFRLLDVPTQRMTTLDSAEAEAMLLISLPGPATELGLGTLIDTVRDKLMLRLSRPAQVRAEKLAARFHLDPDDWYRSAEALPVLPQLARAILDEQRIRFTYRSWTRSRDWTVDPLGIVLKGGTWYLVGDGGKGPMTFRVAAINGLAVTGEVFVRPPRFDLGTWWRKSIADFEARLRPLRADLILSDTGAAKLAEHGHYAAQAVASGNKQADGLALTLPVETIEQAAALLLSLGTECRVVGPPELVTSIRALALAVAARHGACAEVSPSAS
jgi:predicted DNA-binding transcriptional regulator YafY